MNPQSRTLEELSKDLIQLQIEISELRGIRDNHKIITEELKQEHELYVDLANALPAGIYRLRVFHDLSTIQEKWASSISAPYKIEFANDQFFNILHLDRFEFENNPGIINDLIFEEDKASFVKMNVEANLNRTPFTWEGRFKIVDELVWIHFESIPRVLANGDILWTGTLNDVTIRKNSELEIALKNVELQKLNAEKVKFLSIVAHDLKSPFNSIIGFSGLLVDKINQQEFDKAEKYANSILQSSNRAMNLLTNLMEWAQSNTGRMEYNPQYFELVPFINEIVLLYDDIAAKKTIAIKMVLLFQGSIFADRSMISTVFRNLISNAIKFTMPNGEVIIMAEVKLNKIIFSVSDTGVGIPKDSIGKLFQLEHCYTTVGTNHEMGTGLGLILCKEFIEKQGGEIWAESEEGVGSIFYISLPFNLDKC